MYEMSNVLQKEVGILGEDIGRLIERFSTLGDRQSKISNDFENLLLERLGEWIAFII